MIRRRITTSTADAILLGGPNLAVGPLISTPGAPPALPVSCAFKNHALGLGEVSLHARGFGFVNTTNGDRFFLKRGLAKALVSGDLIEFAYSNGESDVTSDVTKVIMVKRNEKILLGEVQKITSPLVIFADDCCITPIRIEGIVPDTVQVGDVLAVQLPGYTGKPTATCLVGTLFKNLGPRTSPNFNLDYALLKYGFHGQMPSLKDLAIEQLLASDQPNSLDYHDTSAFITIDGDQTRDFDDAVHAVRLPNETWEVKVAIADVSWYVQPGSALDLWAKHRATSVYLPGKVLPMLPECLSDERCSLRPHSAKRAVILTAILSPTGDIVESWFTRGIVTSSARVTYSEAQRYYSTGTSSFSSEVNRNLAALYSVHRLLAAQRVRAGRMEFEDPEPVLVSTENGEWNLKWEARTEAHKVVEDFMLLANRIAAIHLVERYGVGIFRHQPTPKESDWVELQNWALQLNHMLPASPNMKSLANLVASQPCADTQAAVSYRVRGIMQPAKYVVQGDPALSSHFTLNFDWYTHFTSPIRRYADILVHRLLLLPPTEQPSIADWLDLESAVMHCSAQSIAARAVEKFVMDRIKLNTLQSYLANGEAVSARIFRQSDKGLKLILLPSQGVAILPHTQLLAGGFCYKNRQWVNSAGDSLHLGRLVSVSVKSINLISAELIVTLENYQT